MIRCPECGTSNEDDVLVCRTCAALLDPDATTPSGFTPPPPPDADETADSTAAAEPVPPSFRSTFDLPIRTPAPAETRTSDPDPSSETPASAASPTTSRPSSPASASGSTTGPPSPRPSQGPPPVEGPRGAPRTQSSPPRRERSAARPSSPSGPPPAAEAPGPHADPDSAPFATEGLDLDPHHLAAVTHHGKGRPIVSVIGFPGSGKSFLVNRWRHELMHRGDWQSYPPPEPRIPRSPEGLILSHLVPSSPGRLARHRGYVVVDCAGESFDIAFERQHRDRELEGGGVRSYLAALGLASAYVLVLEADDLVPGDHRSESDRSATEAMMMAFHDVLGGILVAKDRLRHQSPEDFLQQGISRRELDDAFEERRRFATPICVAFAQADRLQGLREAGVAVPGFDRDPYLFARRHARFLYNAVTRRFDHYRFDFISAFPGYEPDDPANPSPDYRLPSYGTAALFDWVDRLLKPRPPLVGPFGRVAAGAVPTRHAVRLRRLLDPAFRRQTKGSRE